MCKPQADGLVGTVLAALAAKGIVLSGDLNAVYNSSLQLLSRPTISAISKVIKKLPNTITRTRNK